MWWKSGQFWFSAFYFLFWTYLMITAQVFVDNNAPPDAELPDIGFTILPYFNLSFRPEDIFVLVQFVAVVVYFIKQKFGHKVIRRYLFLTAIFFKLRGALIMSTMLPSPNPACTQLISTQPYFDALRVLAGVASTCNDLVISGHTYNLTIFSLIWTEYTNFIWVHVTTWILTIAGMITIIGNRFHYTIDVINGFVVAVMLWSLYHHVLRLLTNKKKTVWWIIEWLEKDHLEQTPEEKTLY